MDRSVLFQHNVETVIWRRHSQNARRWAERAFFRMQAQRMFRYENAICHQARHIVTVSETDSETTRELFGLSKNVSAVPTGVDCEYFAPPGGAEPYRDLIFVGAMDWMPNIDGMKFFVENIWPRTARRSSRMHPGHCRPRTHSRDSPPGRCRPQHSRNRHRARRPPLSCGARAFPSFPCASAEARD